MDSGTHQEDISNIKTEISGDGRFVSPMYALLLAELKTIGKGELLDIGCGNGNL